MDTLKQVSNEMAQLVQTVGNGVVRVEGRKRLPGTGVVWSADGIIVTSHHVVTRDENIRVGLPNGETVEARLLGRDPSTDIALLKVDGASLTVPNWQDVSGAQVGNLVLALGRPGQTVQATLGVVSALGTQYQAPSGGNIDRYVQTDVVMYPGFSGGPLVGADGAVYGINSSALMRGTSITVPTETIRRVGATLQQHGRVRRGYLGITAQAVKLQDALVAAAGQEHGLLVINVEPGSPAASGGVLLGDILLSLDNQTVRTLEELMGALAGDRVGQALPLKLVRGGNVQTLSITIGERA